MRSGFSFKGKHSDDYGAVVRTRSRPVRPEAKASVFEAYAVDGSYDFSDSNPYGRHFYNDRFFELELQISAPGLHTLELKVSKIAGWLTGRGDLIFDDMPSVKWKAAALSEIGFMPELTGHKAVLTAVFRVKPFSRAVFDTMTGIVIGSECMLQSPVPLDAKEYFTFNCRGGAGNTFSVDNIGSWYVRPVIRIIADSALGNTEVSLNEKALSVYNVKAGELVIDCEKQTVTDGNGNNMIGQTEGAFFELPYSAPSQLSVTVQKDAVVTVEYEPRCIYNFDFMDWGEYDA